MGTTRAFAVLAGSAITNTGPTVLNGDLGISPSGAGSVTGFPPGTVNGAVHAADGVALQAKNDLVVAYDSLSPPGCNQAFLVPTDLGGMVLTPGVYCFASSAAITGILTLNFQGNPDAVFIFRTGSTLVTASASSVVMINNGGGQGCNVGCETRIVRHGESASACRTDASKAVAGGVCSVQSPLAATCCAATHFR